MLQYMMRGRCPSIKAKMNKPDRPQQKKNRQNQQKWLSVALSLLVFGIIYGVNTIQNRNTERQNEQVRADVLSETDSLSDLTNELAATGETGRAYDIEIGLIEIEPLSPNTIKINTELINHGSSTENVECAFKAGTADTLRKIHVRTYTVPKGSHTFEDVVEVADAENELLNVLAACLEYE